LTIGTLDVVAVTSVALTGAMALGKPARFRPFTQCLRVNRRQKAIHMLTNGGRRGVRQQDDIDGIGV
jgi:hypothetical protein